MTIGNKLVSAVRRLNLDLSGKTVLTEAATGAYAVTPVLAALAGAEVYAFTRHTRYGSVDDVRRETISLTEELKRPLMNLNIISELTPDIIGKADIITNSGHLRPLDSGKLKFAMKGAVIPLMYEGWEWRDSDIDIEYCRKKNIKIGATRERHPDIDVFNYLGDMALKLVFDSGLCIYKNKFILFCNNDFGPYIAKVISQICDGLAVCDRKENKKKYNDLDIDWIGDFPDFEIPLSYRDSEALIFTAYPFDKKWIGDDALVSLFKIKSQMSNPYILRFAGDIDEDACIRNNIRYFPREVASGHMGILPSAIGADPIIRLQSGGLKVAELMLKNESVFNHSEILEILE